MIRYPYPCTAEARNTVTVCGLRHRVRPLSVAQLAEPLKNKGFTWASLCARAHRVTHPAHSDAFLHPQSNTTRSISASYISTFATSLWITDELYTYPQI